MNRAALSFAAVACVLVYAHGGARADAARAESPDPTRLDVERLPPEAVELKRDMFARGLYLESHLGGRGFVGGLGQLSSPGLLARVGLRFGLTSWLMLGGAAELSPPESNPPAPPARPDLPLFPPP